MNTEKQAEELCEICRKQKVGALATCDGKSTHSSLVFFASSENGQELIFATLRSTRKYANLKDFPDISVLIDSRTENPEDISSSTAVTVSGKAVEAEGDEVNGYRELLLTRHPALADFLDHKDCAVITIQDLDIFTVDTFGKK